MIPTRNIRNHMIMELRWAAWSDHVINRGRTETDRAAIVIKN